MGQTFEVPQPMVGSCLGLVQHSLLCRYLIFVSCRNAHALMVLFQFVAYLIWYGTLTCLFSLLGLQNPPRNIPNTSNYFISESGLPGLRDSADQNDRRLVLNCLLVIPLEMISQQPQKDQFELRLSLRWISGYSYQILLVTWLDPTSCGWPTVKEKKGTRSCNKKMEINGDVWQCALGHQLAPSARWICQFSACDHTGSSYFSSFDEAESPGLLPATLCWRRDDAK